MSLEQDTLLAFSRDTFKWPHLFPLDRPRRFLKLCPCFAILARKIALSCVTITDLPYRRISLLDLVPELNLDLSNSCSIQSFRIKHEVIFLTNTFPCSSAYCSSVPTIPLLFSVNEKLAIQLTTELMFSGFKTKLK